MKLLIVGADVVPPWTEGRKKLVRDLADRLQETCDIRLLTTGNKHTVREKPYPYYEKRVLGNCFKLHALHHSLHALLREWSPDVVLHFPFGTFHGFRRAANEWSIRHVDRVCFAKGIRCLTIFYSITGVPGERLRQIVREPVLSPTTPGWSGWTMTMGVDFSPAVQIVQKDQAGPAVLFMAGLQDRKLSTLHHILQERGLADIIAAAPGLARAGVRIIVAIPLLQDDRLREELQRHFLKSCPEIKLDVRSQISTPAIFSEADLYLFPYRKELTQFIPTSILEAMAAGVPVVMSDLAMLSSLAGYGQTAYVYKAGDANHLEKTVLAALSDPADRRTVASLAQAYVKKHWSLDQTMADLMNIIARRGTI